MHGRRTMRQLIALVVGLASEVRGHGSGAWKDPNHYKGDNSLAGLRFISESPAHKLQVVGTDDGTTWWSIKGECSGPEMSVITLDFSPKGGPANAQGAWQPGQIVWPDGNVWELLPTPTPAVTADDGLNDQYAPETRTLFFAAPR